MEEDEDKEKDGDKEERGDEEEAELGEAEQQSLALSHFDEKTLQSPVIPEPLKQF